MNEFGGDERVNAPRHVSVRYEDTLTLTQHFNAVLKTFNGDLEEATTAFTEYAKAKQRAGDVPYKAVAAVPKRSGEIPIISLRSVAKRYKVGKQPVEALRGVSLDIYAGEVVAIVGASGSGKSTLLQLIGCLDTPSEGTVTVDGRDTSKLHDGALSLLRRSTIGFIFQSFYLQPFLRLGDNVAVPAMFAGTRPRVINEETSALLEKVGLIDRRRHFPKELSGGQIQRAAIARALINKPKIILADEPTGNLDSENSARIVELFKTIRDQLGTTVVIVTHNQDIAQSADRIINLKDGVVV